MIQSSTWHVHCTLVGQVVETAGCASAFLGALNTGLSGCSSGKARALKRTVMPSGLKHLLDGLPADHLAESLLRCGASSAAHSSMCCVSHKLQTELVAQPWPIRASGSSPGATALLRWGVSAMPNVADSGLGELLLSRSDSRLPNMLKLEFPAALPPQHGAAKTSYQPDFRNLGKSTASLWGHM